MRTYRKNTPFFARFLSSQDLKKRGRCKYNMVTRRYPSDSDDTRMVTLKYPSDAEGC